MNFGASENRVNPPFSISFAPASHVMSFKPVNNCDMNASFFDKHGIRLIQAPMAGSQNHRLAAAVFFAGGMGSIPAAMLTSEQLQSELSAFEDAIAAEKENAKATQWGEHPDAEVWLSDINASMLGVGRDRLLDRGLALPAIQFDAEKIPFPNNYFDVVSVAFGLRNMTHKEAALGGMARVIKAGGKVLVLEFSKPDAMIAPIYDIYSFKVLPWLGDKVAKDAASYQYLAESIRMHPDADALKTMMLGVGFDQVDTHRMTGGIVALHIGVKY